jgi:DeoR family fructose operon transcriptional repressor
MAGSSGRQAIIVHGTLASEERLRWLNDKLASDGSVTILDAAAALEVSEMTIRRDLAELEHRGVARRMRGGARAAGPQTFAERRHAAPRAKARIASKLADLVPSSGLVAFDASSTIMRLAAGLDGVRDLTVVTNGPETFGALQGTPGVTALLTGGELDVRTGSLVGPVACRTAAQFAVHTFFASAAAVDGSAGALEATLDEAEVKRNIAKGAERVVLAVNASKLEGRAAAVALEWPQIDVLVTELDPASERLAAFRDLARLV